MNVEAFERDGFAVAAGLVSPTVIERLRAAVSHLSRGRRLLDIPEIADAARAPGVRAVIEAVLGVRARAVRGLFFDKTPEENWAVPWHQDLAIAVRQRVNAAGFHGWSMKAGVPHVHPPAAILDQMAALRIHLDNCDETNGALRLIAGSHRAGKLSSAAIDEMVHSHPAVLPALAAGDALLMRPLLLHASSKARMAKPRRVVHIEFAAADLPEGLDWFEAL
ncbi:MAG: phytanoyl-CoA dioxygenase family protein [Bryobacteraceae bacterium]